MWKNWFSAYRSDDEPGSTREPPDDEFSPEDARGRRKKVIAAVLAGVALLLLILLLCLVLLLTTHESEPAKTEPKSDAVLRSRKMGHLGRNAGKPATRNLGQCRKSPPELTGVVSSWDKVTRKAGTTIVYWCNEDPDEEQVLMVVCTDNSWKIIYEKPTVCSKVLETKKCLGDPVPGTENNPSDWDFESRSVGTRINYRCNPTEGAPIMRKLVCAKDYEWHVDGNLTDNCFCGKPAYYSSPITFVADNWDAEKEVYPPGAIVKYSCKTSMGETHFQTVTCSLNSTWVVTKAGTCFFLGDVSLNYTDSIKYCDQMGGEIVSIGNDAEQDAIRNLLVDEKAFDSTCIHKAYLGIHEDISKQWRSGDGEFVSGISEMFFMVDEGSEKCAAIQRPGYFKLNNVQCTGTSYCQICEYDNNTSNPGCSNPSNKCYLPKTLRGDYAFSLKECQSDGGRLAQVSSIKQLEEIQDLLGKDAHYSEKCNSGFYVDLTSEKRYYKTPANETVNYTKFVDDSRRSMDRHCAVVHELQRYMWSDQDCSLASCFLCRMTGLSEGSVVPRNTSFVPVIPDTKPTLDHRIYIPAGDVAACDLGWVTDGFHCYMFNDTLVNNAEARAICRNNFGSLASLVSPFERNFIVDFLMNRSNVTESTSTWFVESTGGLPSGSDDDIGYPTNLGGSATQCVSVHVSPRVGWSVIDCEAKAGFICHD
uniref:C-type lectin domain-containing protein n=1 Tax=Strigamia maritima TaxID=126957 RepID=T1IM53_STRMM